MVYASSSRKKRTHMLRPITFFIAAFALFACGNADNSSDTPPATSDTSATHPNKPATVQQPASTPLPGDVKTDKSGQPSPQKAEEQVRLVVSFISQGEGIDRKTKETFDTWLKQKGNIKFDAHSWGREGEMNYCFALENLSPNEQDKFVEEVRTQLLGRQLVRMNENTSCENWK